VRALNFPSAYAPGMRIGYAGDVATRVEEARGLARIRHRNVLLVLGADVHDGQAGMWTELVEGATFEQLFAFFGPADWREIAGYGIELCRALSAVHAAGLVHRDVKAENVMRERGGRIVLMDFGSAGAYEGGLAADGQAAAGANAAGVKVTPLATAPEVLAHQPASPASDVFSLGALLFRLVAGRYPVHAETLDDAIRLVNSGAHGNMACLFTSSGAAARRFRRDAMVGNVGINVGVAAPMPFYPFSGWKESFFGDLHAQGRHAVEFYTQTKVVVERWYPEWERRF